MATKIMLVEDDTNLSSIYQARLEAEGFQIITANDGEAALALAVKEKPELIISDVMMPKISGFDMLDILRGTDGIKDTKVIMMTALGQAEDKARADKLGADRYLVKSQVTLEDVVRTVHEVLEDQPAPPAAVSEAQAATPDPAAAEPAAPATANIPVATPDDSAQTGAPEPQAPAAASHTDIPVQSPPEPQAVAAAPLPEPAGPVSTNSQPAPVAADPMPAPAPAPDPITASAPSIPANEEQSSSAEQSKVLSQIEDFLNKQESDAEQKPAAAEPTKETTVTPPAETTGSKDSPATDSAAGPAPATLEADSSSSVPIANKKVIEPIINAKPRASLNDLLTKEQAASPGNTLVPTPGTVQSTDGFISSEVNSAMQAPSSASSVIQPETPNGGLDANKISL